MIDQKYCMTTTPGLDLFHGDCLDIMPKLGQFDCVFMDPPDNIGLKYDGDTVGDNLSLEDYEDWIEQVLCRLPDSPVHWLSFNAQWTLRMARLVSRSFPGRRVKPCVQTFTFGQHRSTDFGNCHRPLWRISRPDAPFYGDQIRVESWRQQNGDPRANPAGRVPGDVFDFPRVTGNSKQRRKWHPTQLHEGLVERCILSCTKPGDRVLDPFAGTGTTGRVCQRIGRNCTLIEKSAAYYEKLKEEFTNVCQPI